MKNGVNTPIKANAPGRLKSLKLAKNGANAPGRLVFFIENAPGTLQTPRGVVFASFRKEVPRGASPRHEKVCEKDLLPKRKGTLRSMQWVE